MKPRKTRQRGIALLVSIVAVICMIGLVLGLFYTSLADNKQSLVNEAMIEATALAEGATEQGNKELVEAASNYAPIPTEGTFTVNGLTSNYVITPVGAQKIGAAIEGLKSIEQMYSISANSETNGMHKHVEKLVNVTQIPLFQFAIFYDKDLEILPGPSLTIHGPVHSNGDLYLGAGATLTLDTQYVRAVGHIYRRRKDDGTPTTGIVNIKVYGENKFQAMDSKKSLAAPSISGFDSAFLGFDKNGDGDCFDKGDISGWTLGALSLWKGTVRTAEHASKEIAAPEQELIKYFVNTPGAGNYDYDSGTKEYTEVAPGAGEYQKGLYYSQADIAIIDGRVYTNDGTEITSWPDVTGDGNPDNPISEGTFYDAREQVYVKTTDVDIDILGKSGHWPPNGLLYAVRTDATVEQPNGVRLKNGAVLSGPLTVVTEDPLYTWGDYNTGGAGKVEQPASIMTDAFNILSGKWDDTKSAGTLPHAQPTQLNVCIMTGGTPTSEGAYSGGFENLPRFHELWTGSPAEIRGSFIYGFDSQIAKGPWAYGGDRYQALSRDWDFWSALSDPNFVPPFSPKITYCKRVMWLSR
jgi:hypothetical protein